MDDSTGQTIEYRDTLFGDLPLEYWPGSPEQFDAEPWKWFVEAREQLAAGNDRAAVDLYGQVLQCPGLESRHYLQAWAFMRAAGVVPEPEQTHAVLGVVVEVAVADGLVIVAAYADGTARYVHQSGGGVFWEKPDDSLQEPIDALLTAGQGVAQIIGPWDGPIPLPPPETGEARLTMLTPSGRHFGQAQYETLANDPVGGPPMAAAYELMMALIAKTEGQQS